MGEDGDMQMTEEAAVDDNRIKDKEGEQGQGQPPDVNDGAHVAQDERSHVIDKVDEISESKEEDVIVDHGSEEKQQTEDGPIGNQNPSILENKSANIAAKTSIHNETNDSHRLNEEPCSQHCIDNSQQGEKDYEKDNLKSEVDNISADAVDVDGQPKQKNEPADDGNTKESTQGEITSSNLISNDQVPSEDKAKIGDNKVKASPQCLPISDEPSPLKNDENKNETKMEGHQQDKESKS